MATHLLALNTGLADVSRLPLGARDQEQASTADVLILVSAGVAAAVATVAWKLQLRIPGHAILRVIFPMACGLALAPRRGGGTLMGGSALASAGLLYTAGYPCGWGALTSLALFGPALDWAMSRVRSGWRVYLGFAAAGLVVNLAALAARGAAKAAGWESAGARPLSEWLTPAWMTYAWCGALAGVLSGLLLFRVTRRGPPVEEPAP